MMPDKMFDFSVALRLLKEGKKVKRAQWGGYWFLPTNHVVLSENDGAHNVQVMNPMIVACLKDNGGYICATPYQEDLLASDWEVVI